MKEARRVWLSLVQWISAALLLCVWLALGAFYPQQLRALISAYEALTAKLPVLEFSQIKRIVQAAMACL